MNPRSWPVPLWFGIILTVLWLVFALAYLSQRDVWNLRPNEAGDLAAGISAPLAFLWLVVATFLQKEELSLQRAELRESREAQQKQARETEALVEQNMEAVAVARSALSENQKQWKEQQLGRLIDSIGERIAAIRRDAYIRRGGNLESLFGSTRSTEPDEVIREAVTSLSGILPLQPDESLRDSAPIKEEVEKIFNAAQAVEFDLVDEAPDDGRPSFPAIEARVDFIRLRELTRLLDGLLSWMRSRRIE